MILTNEDLNEISSFLIPEWEFYLPDISKIYMIQVFDDGNEKYKKFNNKWYNIGNYKDKISLVNADEKKIIYSISKWKVSLFEGYYTVDAMIQIKNLLFTIPDEFKNDDCRNIEKDVSSYLKKFCIHDIIEDYIDLDPEKGKYINYCNVCMTEF